MTKKERIELDARIEHVEAVCKWFAGNGYDKGKDSTGFQIVEIGKREIPPVNPEFRDPTQHFFKLALRAIPYRGVKTNPRKLTFEYEASTSAIERNRAHYAMEQVMDKSFVCL